MSVNGAPPMTGAPPASGAPAGAPVSQARAARQELEAPGIGGAAGTTGTAGAAGTGPGRAIGMPAMSASGAAALHTVRPVLHRRLQRLVLRHPRRPALRQLGLPPLARIRIRLLPRWDSTLLRPRTTRGRPQRS